MKKVLYAALIVLVIYCDSFGMEKSLCDPKSCADEKRAKELTDRFFFPGKNALEILEKNWKEGGHMAAHYPLNEYYSSYNGSILPAALRERKSANFIRYLIKNGADVYRDYDSDYREGNFWNNSIYCLPIAVASLYADPDTVATIINYGGIRKEQSFYESNDKKCSILIRYMREAKEGRNTIANYVMCLEYLIKAGCCAEPQRYDSYFGLDSAAYVPFGRDCGLFHPYSHKATTPLIEAITLEVPEFVELLLKHGADPGKKYDGKSARDVAQEKGLFQKGISLLLKKNEKNILDRVEEQQRAKRQADEARVLEAERRRQQEAKFKEDKRMLGASRLKEYVTMHQNLAELPFLLNLQRDRKEIIS